MPAIEDARATLRQATICHGRCFDFGDESVISRATMRALGDAREYLTQKPAETPSEGAAIAWPA